MGRVLIVDDNEDIRILIGTALEEEGYKVESAANGAEAQDKIRAKNDFCILLLDLMMPIMNGQEFLNWKNDELSLTHLPILVISAQPDENLSGIIGCLRKPLNLTQVFSIVEKHCHVS